MYTHKHTHTNAQAHTHTHKRIIFKGFISYICIYTFSFIFTGTCAARSAAYFPQQPAHLLQQSAYILQLPKYLPQQLKYLLQQPTYLLQQPAYLLQHSGTARCSMRQQSSNTMFFCFCSGEGTCCSRCTFLKQILKFVTTI